MINVLISVLCAVVVTLCTGMLFGSTVGDILLYGFLFGITAGVVSYIILMRRTLKKVEGIMNLAQVEMMSLQEAAQSGRQPSKKELHNTIDRTVAIMKTAMPLSRWQFLVDSQVNGQIGAVYYIGQRYDEAEPFLRNSFFKHWYPQAMLGAIHYRNKDFDKMKEVFEKAVSANEKESLLWGTYAWCLWKNKDQDGAIEVLTRAKANMNDERINSNLLALQNKKKMKMDVWENWFQLMLETPPQAGRPRNAKEMRQMQQKMQRARFGKRSVYR